MLLHQPRKTSFRTIHAETIGHINTAQRRNIALDWTIALAAYVHSIAAISQTSETNKAEGTERSQHQTHLMLVFHSLCVPVFGLALLLSLAPSFSDWRMSSHATNSSSSHTTAVSNESNFQTPQPLTPVWWLSSPTSFGQSILFLVSATYFALDIAALYIRGRLSSSKGQRILTHHLLSIVGLTGPIFQGLDGPLVLLGFVLAECSNPPFHILTLCKYATKSHMRISCASTWLKLMAKPVIVLCLSMDLSLVHILIFVLSRLACLQFTAHAVMPFASLLTTKVTSILLCLLSVAQFVDLCKTLQVGESSSSSGGAQKKALGWKQVMAEMRELQNECNSSSGASAATTSGSHSPTRKGSFGSGDESDGQERRRKGVRGSGGGGVHSPKPHYSTHAAVQPLTDAAGPARKESVKKKLFS